ncbi:MAG: phosphoribosylaminoimidazolesuccinocarboxamide synthase [Thaumarchaeota archaeon]|nr:phosphoribosylaminoimidazolesuccinocarboxamide synthase [Nitrososphaerota archaeon]
MSQKGVFLRSGKVKDIYELDSDHLLFHFSDRVSAFDVILPSTIPKKGEVLCRLSAYWFETLGVPNHMVRIDGPNSMVVERMTMMPVECVVRGYLYGSLYDRMGKGEVSLPGVEKVQAAKLPSPYFDPTTKSETKDEPITESDIVSQGRMSDAELKKVKEYAFSIYGEMSDRAAAAGFLLADLKLEFGRHRKTGEVTLGDSIGPDEFRMWPAAKYSPGRTQESYDKQLVRDWLIAEGYKAKLDSARKAGETLPVPPSLPRDLVDQVSQRYVYVYETLSGRKL